MKRLKRPYVLIPMFVALIGLASCASGTGGNQAAEDLAWDLLELLEDRFEGDVEDHILAVADIESDDVPQAALDQFRDDLTTALAYVFQEESLPVSVVTRSRVDAVYAEQSLSLQGMTSQESVELIGSLLGADLIFAGSASAYEGEVNFYQFSGQVIEASTGIILAGGSTDFWDETRY